MSVFPQIEKLKNNAIIDRVFKEGRRVQSGYLAMHYLKSEEAGGVIFINVAVSKKEVCLSVNRNKIRRILQEWILKNIQNINNHKPYWLLVNLKFGDFCNDKCQLLEEFQNFMYKAHLIK